MNLSTTTEELVRRVGSIPDELSAASCFGAPIERDGHTLIPVARINFGLGMGFGGGSAPADVPGDLSVNGAGGESGGGGGGGGGSATPVAVIDICGDDVIVKPVNDTTRIALGSYALVAWLGFWLFLTVRTVVRQREKTERKLMKLQRG